MPELNGSKTSAGVDHGVTRLATTTLRSAHGIEIRSAALADGAEIAMMFARCSRDARYGRFLAPLAMVPAEHLALVLAAQPGTASWVGVTTSHPAMIVALGSWVACGAEAELAVLVEDQWQRHGAGTALLQVMADSAFAAGFHRLTATVLTESRHVLGMLRAAFGELSVETDGYLCRVTIERGHDG